MVEYNSVGLEVYDVAAEPAGFACPDLGKDLVIAHGCAGKEALVRRREVLQVPVEEVAEEKFGDE